MKVTELIKELNLQILCGADQAERPVTGGICCDLLSWVMAHGQRGSLWITVQTHTNTIAVASLLELSCIIIPAGIPVDPKTLQKAEEEGIPVLSSDKTAYALCGQLCRLGIEA